ncbi:MAG: ABC transporter substrate-binding protein [Kiritimatiellia bacterium]
MNKLSRHILSLLILAAGSISLTSCSNNPYTAEEESGTTYYSAFSTPPLQLDPAEAYWSHQGAIIDQIYEPPLSYHYLKRPYEVVPLTAESVPRPVYYDGNRNRLAADEASAESVKRVEYTIRIKRGIKYQDHPCFAVGSNGDYIYRNVEQSETSSCQSIQDFPQKGTRELKAADYVLQIRRMADPRVECPIFPTLENYILGLTELRKSMEDYLSEVRRRRKEKAGTAYNRERNERKNPIRIDYLSLECPGAEVIDDYTYRITLKKKYPPFRYWLCMHFFAPVPPEALDFYEQPAMIDRHFVLSRCPVGTGPYYVKKFKPNENIVLEKNPNYHPDFYPATGMPEDKEAGLLADEGRRLPFIDRQYLRYEQEVIPRWNKFTQGYYDASGISDDVFDKVIQVGDQAGSHLSPAMRRKGIRLVKYVDTSFFYMAFNMLDDVVGGYTEKKRKLRRAISIAADANAFCDIFMNGRGVQAQGPVPPGIFGYLGEKPGTNPFTDRWDPVMGRHVRKDIDTARRLLAEAGYPGGVGPDGRPLTLYFDHARVGDADFPTQFRWWRKRFNLLGIRLEQRGTDLSQFQIKRREGRWQMVMSGWLADYPDPENFLFLFYGPNSKVRTGGVNLYNYENQEYDELFLRMVSTPNGPERQAIINDMVGILQRDAPAIWLYHPEDYILYHKWYRNAKPHPMLYNTMKYRRIEPDVRADCRKKWNSPVLWPVLAIFALITAGIIPAIVKAYRRERGL